MVPERHIGRALAMNLFLCAVAIDAWAHAALTRSVPGSRETLPVSPTKIELQFNEKVEAKFSTIRLEDEQGRAIPLGSPAVSADDPYQLEAGVQAPLAPGRYTVRYRVLSQDGHVVEYGYQFTVRTDDHNTP